jgi:hypothetical protein
MRFYTTFIVAALFAIQGEAVKLSSMVHKSADHMNMEEMEEMYGDIEAAYDELPVEQQQIIDDEIAEA